MKKFVTLALSFLFIFTMVGCSNKNNGTVDKNGTVDEAVIDETYVNDYSGLYDRSVGTLGAYDMYTNIDTTTNAYKDKEYPGNEKYLSEVKEAYKDSRDKIQMFVDGLKNDVKTEDSQLKKMNEDLIAEGEKAIDDIDAKIKRLDSITKNDYDKTENDFIKFVNDTANEGKEAGDNIVDSFRNMLSDMDKKLNIDRNNK